jgi:transcription initiation factor TFIID subunit 5
MLPVLLPNCSRAIPETSDANNDKQVIEYLVKKGYNRTEQMLRQESSNLDKDGKPIPERVEDLGTQKYTKAFQLLSNWVDSNLDIYKVNPQHCLHIAV